MFKMIKFNALTAIYLVIINIKIFLVSQKWILQIKSRCDINRLSTFRIMSNMITLAFPVSQFKNFMLLLLSQTHKINSNTYKNIGQSCF
jgi:hypothetical protein